MVRREGSEVSGPLLWRDLFSLAVRSLGAELVAFRRQPAEAQGEEQIDEQGEGQGQGRLDQREKVQ